MRSLLQPRTPLQQQCHRWPHNIRWGFQQQQQETLKIKSGTNVPVQPQHLFRWSAVESLWSRSDLSRSKFRSICPIYTRPIHHPINLRSPVMNTITTKDQHWIVSNISQKKQLKVSYEWSQSFHHLYKKCQVMESIFCESLERRLYIGGSDWALKMKSIPFLSQTHTATFTLLWNENRTCLRRWRHCKGWLLK